MAMSELPAEVQNTIAGIFDRLDAGQWAMEVFGWASAVWTLPVALLLDVFDFYFGVEVLEDVYC